MTRDELIRDLERLARQTLDRACIEDASADVFQAVYDTLRDQRPATEAAHRRLLELDPYVNGCRRAADQLRGDVATLRDAIKAIEQAR